MKNAIAKLSANKNVIIRRTLIIGGTVVGLVLVAGLLTKMNAPEGEALLEAVTES